MPSFPDSCAPAQDSVTRASLHNEYISYSHRVTYTPNQEILSRMHAHEMHEVYYFISGAGTYVVEGTEHVLTPGTLLIMRANEAHMPRISWSAPYERVAAHFTTSFIDARDPHRRVLRPFLDRALGVHNRFGPERLRMGFVDEAFRRMAQARGDEYERTLYISATFFTILCEIAAAFSDMQAQEPPPAADSPIHEVLQYINTHLSEEISLSSLSAQFFTSKSQLLRLFKRATGSTVWEYVTVKRLNAARALLHAGEGAQAAASACGFSDYSTFYKAYLRRFGVSPSRDRPVLYPPQAFIHPEHP